MCFSTLEIGEGQLCSVTARNRVKITILMCEQKQALSGMVLVPAQKLSFNSVNTALILSPLTTGATRTKIQTKNKNSAMVMLGLETTKKKQKPCLHV